jgi:hypothetical protein
MPRPRVIQGGHPNRAAGSGSDGADTAVGDRRYRAVIRTTGRRDGGPSCAGGGRPSEARQDAEASRDHRFLSGRFGFGGAMRARA